MSALDFTATPIGAAVLLARLRKRWARTTWPVRFWIERVPYGGETLHCVRSDLIDGIPRGLWEQQRVRGRGRTAA